CGPDARRCDLLRAREGHAHRADPSRHRWRLETRPANEVGARSWDYGTLRLGQGEEGWRQVFAALRIAGYNDRLSIEHEDSLIDPLEGVRKSVELLRNVAYR